MLLVQRHRNKDIIIYDTSKETSSDDIYLNKNIIIDKIIDFLPGQNIHLTENYIRKSIYEEDCIIYDQNNIEVLNLQVIYEGSKTSLNANNTIGFSDIELGKRVALKEDLFSQSHVNEQLNNKIGIIFNVSSCYQNGKDQYFFKVGFIDGSIRSVTIKAENVTFI